MANPVIIGNATLYLGDALTVLATLPDCSVHCVVTSPPYWGLRDYGVAGQFGLESTPAEYVEKMVAVFADVRRVLRDDGTLWLNLGDSYSAPNGRSFGGTYARGPNSIFEDNDNLPAKNLIGIPWRVAFALQADGWYLRQDIIWSKPNPMPESVRDRCTKAHEYLFMLAKSERYYYDQDAIKDPAIYFDDNRKERAQDDHKSSPTDERNGIRLLYKDARSYDGKHSDKQRGHGRRHAGFNDRWDTMKKAEQCGGMRNKRSVWTVATQPYKEAHFATFPPKLIEPCVLAGCPADGVLLDPFAGSGTAGEVALLLGRRFVGIELSEKYFTDLLAPRIENAQRQERLFA